MVWRNSSRTWRLIRFLTTALVETRRDTTKPSLGPSPLAVEAYTANNLSLELHF